MTKTSFVIIINFGFDIQQWCGSQNAIFIPELDLAIASFGANYNSPTINYLLNVLIPTYILPAVEPGK